MSFVVSRRLRFALLAAALRSLKLVVALGLFVAGVLGCGGRRVDLVTLDHSAHPPPAGSTPLDAMRFGRVSARRSGWCGLRETNGDLVCVTDGVISEQQSGPFADLDLIDSGDWSYRCLLRPNGQVVCDGQPDLSVPLASFQSVAVGLHAACAVGDQALDCWRPAALPQIAASGAVNVLGSVQEGNVCWNTNGVWSCQGVQGERWLPAPGNYSLALATRDGACAAIVPLAPGLPSGLPPDVDAALHTAQISCFSAQGMSNKLLGYFSVFDVGPDADGCGYDSASSTAVCWGHLGGAVPSRTIGPYLAVSVADAQACWLAASGVVECAAPP